MKPSVRTPEARLNALAAGVNREVYRVAFLLALPPAYRETAARTFATHAADEFRHAAAFALGSCPPAFVEAVRRIGLACLADPVEGARIDREITSEALFWQQEFPRYTALAAAEIGEPYD